MVGGEGEQGRSLGCCEAMCLHENSMQRNRSAGRCGRYSYMARAVGNRSQEITQGIAPAAATGVQGRPGWWLGAGQVLGV